MDLKQKIYMKYLEELTKVRKYKYVYDYDLVLYLEKKGFDYITIVYSKTSNGATAVFENSSELRKYIRRFDQSRSITVKAIESIAY